MISNYGRRLFVKPLQSLVPWMIKVGITPNAVTVAGFGLTVIAALLLGIGRFFWGGLVLTAGALLDMVDGHLARATGQTTVFGAFWDSTLDRYSESVILIALVFFYGSDAGSRTAVTLLAITLVGSLMVSYTRARAEALNLECKVGILQRPERLVLLIGGLLTGWMMPVLWILAILTNVTALQRVYQVYTLTHEPSSATTEKAAISDDDDWPGQG